MCTQRQTILALESLDSQWPLGRAQAPRQPFRRRAWQ